MMREEGKQGEGKQESLNTQKSLPPISELPMLLLPVQGFHGLQFKAFKGLWFKASSPSSPGCQGAP